MAIEKKAIFDTPDERQEIVPVSIYSRAPDRMEYNLGSPVKCAIAELLPKETQPELFSGINIEVEMAVIELLTASFSRACNLVRGDKIVFPDRTQWVVFSVADTDGYPLKFRCGCAKHMELAG